MSFSILSTCPHSSPDLFIICKHSHSHRLIAPLSGLSISISMSMAASSSLHPLRRHHHATPSRPLGLEPSSSPPTPRPPSLLLKPTPYPFRSISFSASNTTTATAAPTTSSQPATFDLLQQHLAAQNLREADSETRRLLIQLAGEAAQARGYVFFSEVQFISKQDLQAIDALWRHHTNSKYGYSVQRKIWTKLNKDFTKFFIKLGWMKRLESSEVEQYNYRAFPDEFMWELTDETPEGHLPLTNALRGTQLFTCILNHPAFQDAEDDSGDADAAAALQEDPPAKAPFKPDYSF